jgi:YD repeat-containing protein
VEEPNPAYGQADNTGTNFVTSYTYDLEGHLTGVSMPRPNGGGTSTQTRSFNYNLATGKLTSATNPENGTVSYGYYTDGPELCTERAFRAVVPRGWCRSRLNKSDRVTLRHCPPDC